MPIAFLQRGAAFPEIGQLRKGAVKPESGKAPGKDLHYFRFTSNDPDTEKQFAEAFGKEPQSIGVFLPLPTLNDNFEAWCEEYTAGAIQHRCDGVTCVGWRDGKGAWQTTPKPCPGGCKATGRLKVFIPAFQRMAFVTVLTTSKHDIINLHASLSALEAVKGSVQGIPLILRRVEREISTPGANGQRARRKKWLLQIEAEPQWAALQFGAMREAALITAGREPLLLESGEIDDDEEGETPKYATAEMVAAVRDLWPKFGIRKEGQIVPFERILHENKWTQDTWPYDRALKTLESLQAKAVAAEQARVAAMSADQALAEVQAEEAGAVQGEVV